MGASTGLHHWHEWDDVFQCGRFDTKDVREGKTTTSTRRGEAVSNLQSLFQFAGLKQIPRGGGMVGGGVLMDNSEGVLREALLSERQRRFLTNLYY